MKKTFEVANIRCGGCANTITKAMKEAGFDDIEVDLECEPRKVTATITDEANETLFKTTLRKLGYPLTTEMGNFGEDVVLKAKSFVSCAVGKMS